MGRCKQQHRHGRANHPVSRTTPLAGQGSRRAGASPHTFLAALLPKGHLPRSLEPQSAECSLHQRCSSHHFDLHSMGRDGGATRRGREELEAHKRAAMPRPESNNRHRCTQKERPARRVGEKREESSSHRHGAVALRCAQRQRSRRGRLRRKGREGHRGGSSPRGAGARYPSGGTPTHTPVTRGHMAIRAGRADRRSALRLSRLGPHHTRSSWFRTRRASPGAPHLRRSRPLPRERNRVARDQCTVRMGWGSGRGRGRAARSA